MSSKNLVILFGLGLFFVLLASSLQPVPGYMDADYYFASGIRMVQGEGYSEPFLWNYLDDPVGIPHPSHLYWMPLASIIAAAGMAITGQSDYFSARLLFFLLAAFIPPLTAWLSYSLTRKKSNAFLAGGFAIFSGFYVVYTGLVETFVVYMLLGTIFIVLAYPLNREITRSMWRYVALGLIAGGMHLARADGVLWLAAALIISFIEWLKQRHMLRRPSNLKWLQNGVAIFLCVMAGYLALMGGWYWRNINLYGTLTAPGASRTLWLTNYDQMFTFPASSLTFTHWVNTGWLEHIKTWVDALIKNFGTLLGVQSSIMLLPLIFIGLWRLRKNSWIRFGSVMWLAIFFLMSFVFPFAGARGGFFHSGSAVQLLLWAAAPVGFQTLIEIGVRKRNWKVERATLGFGAILLGLCFVFSLAVFFVQVIGENPDRPAWRESYAEYRDVDQQLSKIGAPLDRVVMVNNPPGYFVATGKPAIVIPDGGIDILLQAASTYQADYVILEKNTVNGLVDLFQHPKDLPGIKFLTTVNDLQLFQVTK